MIKFMIRRKINSFILCDILPSSPYTLFYIRFSRIAPERSLHFPWWCWSAEYTGFHPASFPDSRCLSSAATCVHRSHDIFLSQHPLLSIHTTPDSSALHSYTPVPVTQKLPVPGSWNVRCNAVLPEPACISVHEVPHSGSDS